MDILNEEQGVLIAQQSLNELRVFLNGSEAHGSEQETGDKDFALRAQLEDLNDFYQMLVDARFARSLVEDENERIMMGNGNGDLEMMRSIVRTARDIMALESYIGDGYLSDELSYDDDDDDVDDSSITRAGPSSGGSITVGYVLQGAQYLHDLMEFPGSNGSHNNSPKTPTASCAACFDENMSFTGRFEAPCGHLYCPKCIRKLVSAYISQETPKDIFRCCPGKAPIPIHMVKRFINPRRLQLLQRRIEEASTPLTDRIYCPQEECRRFIDPVRITARARDSGNVICPSTRCRVVICLRCKEVVHSGTTCEESSDSKKATEIRSQFGWGQCPRCKFVIEKIDGCSSISCRCGAAFTYMGGIN